MKTIEFEFIEKLKCVRPWFLIHYALHPSVRFEQNENIYEEYRKLPQYAMKIALFTPDNE